MNHVFYSDVDLLITEDRKEIIMNPKGKRFYFVGCEEQGKIFRDAILRYDSSEERYEIKDDTSIRNNGFKGGRV